ncbi:colicin E3/pyocin S6 family cytotoxin [Burkholderia plantarii]|uniref:colicin E3/pyocin S6 family cytotoxin n=1 Tax=Burkholderia plantarii TaxID=41899 RepID=UPI0018DD03E6|nr:hypothetical protein [Burkholderia plantarii]
MKKRWPRFGPISEKQEAAYAALLFPGCICEWDCQHGEVERYDKRGNHTGHSIQIRVSQFEVRG